MIYGGDQDVLELYRLRQELHLAVDPLGDAKAPYMHLAAQNISLQEYLTYRQNQMRSRIIFRDISELSNTISEQNKAQKQMVSNQLQSAGLTNTFEDWVKFNQSRL